MSSLQELNSLTAVQDFIKQHALSLVTFSAHWCGPCRSSKPQLEALAKDQSSKAAFAICYENDLGDDIHKYNVRAFPTYVLFQHGVEVGRIEGVNIQGIQDLIAQYAESIPSKGGDTLGGGSGTLTPEQARAQRLARLGAVAAPATIDAAVEEDAKQPAEGTAVQDMDEDKNEGGGGGEEEKPKDDDVEMTDVDENEADKKSCLVDPTADLDQEAIKTLTESMGFALIRAQKGLLYGNGNNVEGAVEWLMQHQDDEDIDDPIPLKPAVGGGVAQSYKCNECGKILSNLANLELHANKTGHSDFEESTEAVKPLTPEEKAKKIEEIKELLKAKRAEREEEEKVDHIEREKQRRFMGKEMAKTREQMEIEQRKREAQLRKKEKQAYKRERERIRAELAKDKAERQANKGKLHSKLGVDGYQPDGIQYDAAATEGAGPGLAEEQQQKEEHQRKKVQADVKKIEEYIQKVSSYRAGGDGGKCLKVLGAYVGNIVNHPEEPKYKIINMENKAFKTKVKPFIGAKHLLVAVGFKQTENGDALVLDENADQNILAETKAKLEAALASY